MLCDVMDKFAAVENRFKRTPVRLSDYPGATGVLRLRGRKSRLEVSSNDFLHLEPIGGEDWYDIRLRSSDGRDLLLHHAITLSTGRHHWGPSADDAHTLSIFPNIVVDDLRGLSEDRRVQGIQFRLRGLHNFFHYQHAESLRANDATPEQLEALGAMRRVSDREEGPFQPSGIYLVHRFAETLSFRVGDRTYEVWSGGEFSGGNWDRIDARTYPVAEIRFDQLVSIDAALDRVWEWRRFFSQMAMMPLTFEAISVRGSLDDQASSANLYLPNLDRKPFEPSGRHALSARHLAYNFWRDRDRLQEGMQLWLEREIDRRRFRVGLDRVLGKMDRRIDPADLIELGSAVEGLSELTQAAVFPPGALDAITAAAHLAATEAEAGISRERIAGLIGALQRPSLTDRFTRLGNGLEPQLSAAEATLLARSATRIRNAAAHGGAMTDQIQPRVGPTIEALAALCARFDLETCGFPSHSAVSDAPTMTRLRLDEALDQLRAME